MTMMEELFEISSLAKALGRQCQLAIDEAHEMKAAYDNSCDRVNAVLDDALAVLNQIKQGH